MPRPARRRGGDGASGGVSSDKVSVLALVNGRGDVMAVPACRGKLGVADASRAMAGCALEGAVVSTDRQKGYVRALAEMGVAAHRRFASSGPRAPLNHVNALHSAIKAFLARFRGVSTRRLGNYLLWFRWAHEARRSDDGSALLRSQMETGTYRTSWRGLWDAPYPFHPEIAVSEAG